jgi:diguanylate cyclase (GGDEF)-like protein
LGNAIKFTQNGEVRLRVRFKELDNKRQQFSIEVSDTGSGIDPVRQTKIFEAFSQGDETTTRRFGGTGLGLAITKQLVELMGSQIELESEIGKGSCFRFTFELDASETQDLSMRVPENLDTARVLVVDDHAVNRDILHNQLLAWGIRNDCKSSGSEALECLRMAALNNDPYRIALLDFHMLDMNGIELAHKIKSDNSIPQINLILLSSESMNDDTSMIEKANILCKLLKPVRQEQLLNALCRAMGCEVKSTKLPEVIQQKFSGNILLAEDNIVNQEVALGMLTAIGCSVDLVENGIQAVNAFRQNNYDLVLMDCHMPEMDGFTAAREIREIELLKKTRKTPIIALTADIQKGIKESCLNAGMDSYMSKPFSRISLVEVFKQWLVVASAPMSEPDSDALPLAHGEQIVDEAVVRELHQLGSEIGKNVLEKAAAHFLENTPRECDILLQAITEMNLEQIRRTAHSLKSASANMGAIRLSGICATLEAEAAKNELHAPLRHIQLFNDLVPKTMAQFQVVLKKYSPDFFPVYNESDAVDTKGLKGCILIVDDDPNFLMITAERLMASGFRVIQAMNGMDALALAHKHCPDIVLLDALMEGMDGFEVCYQLRQIKNFKASVLMVTGLDDTESVSQAFDAGAEGFVGKPVNYPILVQQIRFMMRAQENSRTLLENQEQMACAQKIAGLGYWRWESGTDEVTMSNNLAKMLHQNTDGRHCTLNDLLSYIHEEDRGYIRNMIMAVAEGATVSSSDYRLVISDKSQLIVHQELGVAQGASNVVLGTVQDITVQRMRDQQTRDLAYTDVLTGLANRAYFYQHTENVIQLSRQCDKQFALLFIDLDAFKNINDSLGHTAGDQLLKVIGKRLSNITRSIDLVARLSGDEFCMLISDIEDKFTSAQIADRCLRDLNQPVCINNRDIRTRCSIGIVHYPEHGTSLETLIQAADNAMYDAKESGKHRYSFYHSELSIKANERFHMEQQLRLAIERNQLELHYQPQIAMSTGKMIGVEALLRWRHPELGLVPPTKFITMAENIGMIKEVGNWVLRAACEQAIKWQQKGLPLVQMAVNISPLHFQDPSLLDSVKAILAETSLTPELLELEITESVAQTGGDNRRMIDQLRALGVRIAIDDFGTGYSSLGSLKNMALDCLKIDRMFIADMMDNRTSIILLGSMVSLAHALGYTVVAEGAESFDQVHILAGINCDVIQGFVFSRAVVPEEIELLLKKSFLPKYNPVSFPQLSLQEQN